jgi:hypothetical protein
MRRHAVILAAALAWLVSIETAEAKLDILVDKATQRMLVIQDGYMRYIWPVSTGRDEMATPNGVYAPQRMERSWFSNAYYNSPMPYSIFFHNGYAIHGSFAINQLGGPASHGCVRLHPHHAALLFDLVQQEGPANTTIEITDEARPEPASLPGREIAAPGREIAAGRGVYSPVTRIERYRQPGEMPELPPALRGNRPIVAKSALPPRQNTNVDVTDDARPDEPPLPGREVGAGRSLYPPAPRIVRYREPADLPEPPPVLRNRPIVTKNAWPPRPPPPPAGRRILADVRPAASPARAPCGGEADTANESSDCRPKPKVVEAPSPEQAQQTRPKPKVAEGSSPEQPQQAPAVYGFKLLPSSCWSGGASRWRWWGSSQGTPCR